MGPSVYQPATIARDPLLILGARSFAREVADLVGDVPALELRGFVENLDPARCDTTLEGLPVYWVDRLASMAPTHVGLCALGSTARRGFIELAVGQGLRFITLVHPSSRVSSRSTVGAGSLVCPGAHVASHTRIGSHVLVNRGALIGHDVEIGDYVTLGPGVAVGGFCRIGAGAYVGIGATLVDRVTVGTGAVVAAGTMVRRSVPDYVMVGGPRAAIVKRDVNGL